MNIYNTLLTLGTGALVGGLIWYILLVIGTWKMFEKAGIAGWKSLIPIYNTYLTFKICWQPSMFWWWVVSAVLGIWLSGYNGIAGYLGIAAGIVYSIIVAVLYYNLSLSFGHGLGYFLGLYFLTPIFIMVLGFGASRYSGSRYYSAGF
jgi:hypothetical protein